MWQTRQALEASTDYTRMDGNRWRASYRGFVSVEGVGESPHASQNHLEQEFDQAVARLVARTARVGAEASGTLPEPEPIRRHAAKRPARPTARKAAIGPRVSGKKRRV